MTTYRYGSQSVTLNKGIITASNTPNFPVGSPMTVKQLKACGWKAERKPKTYFANGTTSGNRFLD